MNYIKYWIECNANKLKFIQQIKQGMQIKWFTNYINHDTIQW